MRPSLKSAGWGCVAALALSALLVGSVSAQAVPASDTPIEAYQEPSPDDPAQQLVDRFTPVMVLKQQEEPCDTNGEPFRPTSVDIVLDNPEVALRQVGNGDPTATRGPSGADLFGLGEGFYLDFPGSSLEPGCIYERDFDKYSRARPVSVYAHVVQQPNKPGLVFVQYWFYWYYNDWNNKHESDWEGIMLKFEASSIEEALSEDPVAVGYAQHVGGEVAEWEDDKLERVGDHPVVYSAARSHASYFGEALYLGRSASEGFGCDDTDGPSDRVETQAILLPDGADSPDDPYPWLAFSGRWGERQSGSFNAPNGPSAKARWMEPAPWFADLRDQSVVIPTGDSQAASVVSLFCDVVERSSMALVSFLVSPAQILLVLGVIALLVSLLIRRTEWNRVEPSPLVRRRRIGQIIRAAPRVYLRQPLAYILFGLVYIPALVLAGLVGAVMSQIPFVTAMYESIESDGGGVVIAIVVGTIANLFAFVVVNALVAEHFDHKRQGVRSGLQSAVSVWRRRRALIRSFLRTFVIVFGLMMTVVGMPFGVLQLVRYQFVPQAVMIDEVERAGALSRSSQLVRHRWFHTALIVSILNGLVVVVAAVIALLMLLVVGDLPWWAFSLLTSLVYAVLVPAAAIAMTLLYGDAVAEHDERLADEAASESRGELTASWANT